MKVFTCFAWIIAVAALLACCSDRASSGSTGADASLDKSDTEPVAARLSHVVGDVEVRRADSHQWNRAANGTVLFQNDKLRTLRASFATVEFVNGGVLKLGPETLVAVSQLNREPATKGIKSTFLLVQGQIEAEIGDMGAPGSEFRLRTPTAEIDMLPREVAFR